MTTSKMSTPMQVKRIIAFDPGYDRLGVAVIEQTTLLFSDCIETNKQDPHEKRLAQIAQESKKIMEEFTPEICALEKLFWGKNHKTALAVAESRGVILALAGERDMPVHQYSPADIKIAVTGYGRSTKDQVMAMVPKIIPIEKDIKLDDEYDAIAVALTCEAIERFQ